MEWSFEIKYKLLITVYRKSPPLWVIQLTIVDTHKVPTSVAAKASLMIIHNCLMLVPFTLSSSVSIPEERWWHRRSAKKVGLQGKAIGMDGEGETFTSINDLRYPAKTNDTEHAELARGNAEKEGTCNVSFIEASITFIPLPDSTTDCTISNCVLNLVPTPDKHLVFS
ncbi:uncharacterized protein N7518_001627 [Penicillium psychrosexuale]|uniref:uncharacterized protein n=1 Tax=Penicillium psychrosexuale TaxID=1002107 RepID=UPI002544D879|nr:uncharacterized protein N7518_001627 [Penicillium psychrosexuale]KAJ5799559.1 hypothetical protein N7518_001627 [Penicillium psychrosexuale]